MPMKNQYNSILHLMCILLVSVTILNAQAEDKKNQRFVKVETPKYEIQRGRSDVVYLPMEFTGATAMRKLSESELEKVKSVSLIYTQYKLSETFDQYQLNMQRMDALFQMFPHLKSNKSISFYWIGQTGCTDPVTCKSYFHGFEIQLFAEEEILESKRENYLMDIYTDMYAESSSKYPEHKLDSLSAIPGSGIGKGCDTVIVAIKQSKSNYGQFNFRGDSKEKIASKLLRRFHTGSLEFVIYYAPNAEEKYRYDRNPAWTAADQKYVAKLLRNRIIHKPARIKGVEVPAKITVQISAKGVHGYQVNAYYQYVGADMDITDLHKEMFVYREQINCYYIDSGFAARSLSTIEDVLLAVEEMKREPVKVYVKANLVGKVLDRNTQWKNCVVVTDVTGSMYPYLGQFLAWHQLNLKTSKNNMFVFFNDGDRMYDHLKKVGKTGGIYKECTTDYKKLNEVLNLAKASGGGGDSDENDIEACIYALSAFEKADGIILIADNWSKPRDMELISKVKKPIHIILCGTENGATINTVYLNLVKKNGGSIHTLEEDLNELAKLNEGETVKIGNETFVIHNSKFEKQFKLNK